LVIGALASEELYRWLIEWFHSSLDFGNDERLLFLYLQERLNQVLMEKKKESRSGMEIMNLLQVRAVHLFWTLLGRYSVSWWFGFYNVCKQKEGRQRGTWNGKKADNDFYKKIVCWIISFHLVFIVFAFCKHPHLLPFNLILKGGCLWGKKSRTDGREYWFKSIVKINAGRFMIYNYRYMLKFLIACIYECKLFHFFTFHWLSLM